MKFQYGHNVMVTNGFYKGLNGFVTEFEKTDSETGWNRYYVEMEGLRGNKWCTVSDWISENDLRINQ